MFLLYIVPVLAVMAVCCGEVSASEQTYNYKVDYSFMGLKKTAAHARIGIDVNGDDFKGTLNGHSIEWGGRIYTVSDTLVAKMTHTSGHLSLREHVVFRIGWYSKPTEAQAASGLYDFTNPKLYRNTDGMGSLDASEETMEAVSITTDMLAMFYAYRHISFGRLTRGREYLVAISLPDGTRQHLLFRYCGESAYKINGVEYPTYKTEFEYYFNGRPSGYTVRCEVERESRIPLLFSGKLKIGHVEMIYEP